MSNDITEGRANKAIAVDIGNLTGTIWTNTGVDYDVAIGGVPFLLDATDLHPYKRSTVQFRKNQFDTQRDPGEQSITGWWLRSQSSFHSGMGIDFYDPFANPFSTTLASNSYRYNWSLGVNPWKFGQVTLLNRPSQICTTTAARHIESVNVGGVDYILLLDGNIFLVDQNGTKTTLVTAVSTIYSMCTDGQNVYYIDTTKVYKQPLTGGAATTLYTHGVASITSSAMHWVKQRLVAGINNSLYELAGSGSLPSPIYTHPATGWAWTDIEEAGPAIYATGYVGGNSSIYMFVLTSTGTMPVLTSAITVAQLPQGESIYSMYSHLGEYLVIGTNKGVRVAQVDQTNGYITYGPLIVETDAPVRGFAARNSYVWFGTVVNDPQDITDYAGTWRIDLSTEIDTLRFACAQDVYAEAATPATTYDVAFLGNSDRIGFIASTDMKAMTPANSGLFLTSATEVYPSGYIQTGQIRMNMLEPKNFKRVIARGDYGIPASTSLPAGATKGSLTISSVDSKGNIYTVNTYNNNTGTPESTITSPTGGQDSIALCFTLTRDAIDNTLSPVFTGYQLKSVPATPRTRMIEVPMLCYDVDTDKYNATLGYEGFAWDRLSALETIEANGDVVTFQDFRTGEVVQCLIEDLQFVNKISPDKRLTNFAGTIIMTIRTV